MRTTDNKVLNRIPLNYETKDRDAIKDWIAGPFHLPNDAQIPALYKSAPYTIVEQIMTICL